MDRTNLRIPPDLSPVSIRLALLFLLLRTFASTTTMGCCKSHCGGKEDSAHSDQHWILICRSPPLRGLDELRERSHGAASIRGRSITLSNQHSHCTIACVRAISAVSGRMVSCLD